MCSGRVWVSQSSVVCNGVQRGTGGRLHVAVSVGCQHGTGTGVISYDAPGVSSGGRSNCPVHGGADVSVVGAGYGAIRGSVRVRIGGSGCESWGGWTADTAVVCVGSAGVSGSRGGVVSVGVQAGS